MGISTYILYGIDLEDSIKSVYGFTETYGHNCPYQWFLSLIGNMLCNENIHVVDPSGGGNDEIYFGLMAGDYPPVEAYNTLLSQIDSVFNEIKNQSSNWDQDDIDEFIAQSNVSNISDAWDKFFQLKKYIVKETPHMIPVAEYG